MHGNICDVEHFWWRFSSSKWTQPRASFYQFSEHLFMVVSKHWTKRILLNDNIVWLKNSRLISKISGSFFLFNVPLNTKSGTLTFQKKLFYLLQESPLKMRKSAFYFTLKVFFILKKLRYLSRLYGRVEKSLV